MFKTELKKIWIDQKGCLIGFAFLLAYVVFCIISGYESSYAIDSNEAAYQEYISRWQGAVTEQKAKEIEDEYDRIIHADSKEQKEKKAAILTIYNQYDYAKEDSSKRYLLEERGWNTLLCKDEINVFFVLCLVFLCVPVFCREYQCGMDQILRSSRNGRMRLAVIKLMAMIGMSVVITLLFSVVQSVYLMQKVGLLGASYPLQSLRFFENSPYAVTIGEAYGIILLCRCMGAAYFALLLAVCSIGLKKTVPTIFAGIALSILPHLFGGSYFKYMLPLPAGMLAGNGYLWGRLTEMGYDENWNPAKIVTFQGITPQELRTLLAATLFLCVLFFILSTRLYIGKKGKRLKWGKRAGILLCCMFFGVNFGGCASKTQADTSHLLTEDGERGCSGKYEIRLEYETGNIYAARLEDGEEFLLNRDCFSDDKEISAIYVTEDACYYLRQGGIEAGFEIYKVSLTDFSESLFYSNIEDNTSDFWGLHQKEATEDELLAEAELGWIESFLVDGNDIYYAQDEKVHHVNRGCFY